MLVYLNGIGNASNMLNTIGADNYSWQITPSTGVTFETGSQNGVTAQAGRVGVRFATTGTYTVVLTTTNFTNGCTSSTSKTITVAAPVANFTMDRTLGCSPLTINLTNTSSDAANIQSYAWSFPTVMLPLVQPVFTNVPNQVVFPSPGAYDGLQLTVTDVNGCTSTAIQNGIQSLGVSASFTSAPVEGCVPAQVVFTDNSTIFPVSATISNYAWDLQNNGLRYAGAFAGTSQYYEYADANASTASYNIAQPDNYQLKHVVTILMPNGLTCKDSILKMGFTGYAPVAYFTAPSTRCSGQIAPITNLSAGTGSLTHTWYESINGSAPVINPNYTGATPNIQYNALGVYTLCDEVTEGTALACKDSFCRSITVADPIVYFAGTNLSISCPPLVPSLLSTSQNLTNTRWEIWKDVMDYSTSPPTFVGVDYANGLLVTTQNQQIFDFVLTESGSYSVKLFGTTASGCVDSLVRNSYINIGGPTAYLDNITPRVGYAPLSTNVHIINGFGNNSIFWQSNDQNNTFYSQNTSAAFVDFQHTYTQPGTYYPTFTASNGAGCDITITPQIAIIVKQDCVFPGDANNDQIADNRDLLPIALHNAETGLSRQNASTVWHCENIADWLVHTGLPPYYDLKYSDCNGNGTIEATDTLVILQNYNRTHNGTVATNKPMNAAPIFLDFGRKSIAPTQYPYTVTADVHIGDATETVANLAGAAFTVTYSKNAAHSAKFKPANLGFLGSNVYHLNKDISIAADSLNYLDIAVARTDGLSSTGDGIIGSVEFTITDNIIGKGISTGTIRTNITDILAISPDETPIPLTGQTASIKVENMIDLALPTTPKATVSISPNPNNGVFKIKNNGNFLDSITLYDALGRAVFTQIFVENTVNPTLHLEYLPSGVYFATISTNNDGNTEKTVQRVIVR